jgi:hypothetical protein
MRELLSQQLTIGLVRDHINPEGSDGGKEGGNVMG